MGRSAGFQTGEIKKTGGTHPFFRMQSDPLEAADRNEVEVLVYSEVTMTKKHTLTSEEISKIVNGINPIDWLQMELLAKMPPGKRIYPSLQASAMIRAGLQTAFKRKFPNLSPSEINMKILDYLIFMDGKYGHA